MFCFFGMEGFIFPVCLRQEKHVLFFWNGGFIFPVCLRKVKHVLFFLEWKVLSFLFA